jgi:hypothetical protein
MWWVMAENFIQTSSRKIPGGFFVGEWVCGDALVECMAIHSTPSEKYPR